MAGRAPNLGTQFAPTSPASLITFAHFLVSASIYPRKCAGVSPAGHDLPFAIGLELAKINGRHVAQIGFRRRDFEHTGWPERKLESQSGGG